MNQDSLEAGRRVLDQLRHITDVVESWVANLGSDPWPGRRDEAITLNSRAQRALQDARTEIGSLVAVLAQDVAP